MLARLSPWLALPGLWLLSQPALAVLPSVPASWEIDPQIEQRTVPTGLVLHDAQGWYTESPDFPPTRIQIDPTTGATTPSPRVGRVLPINGGSVESDMGPHPTDICFGDCRPIRQELRRRDRNGRIAWAYPLPLNVVTYAEWPGVLGVTAGHSVFGLESDNGALLWVHRLPGCAFQFLADGLLWQSCSGVSTSAVLALGPEGQVLWRHQPEGILSIVRPLPQGGAATVVSQDGQLYWEVLSTTGSVLVRQRVDVGERGDLLIAASGQAAAVGVTNVQSRSLRVHWLRSTASAPVWTRELRYLGSFSPQLFAVHGDEQVLVLSDNGNELSALSASDGQQRWLHALATGSVFPTTWRTATPWSGTHFAAQVRVGSQFHWRGIRLADGASAWQSDTLSLPVQRDNEGIWIRDRLLIAQLDLSTPQRPQLLIDEINQHGALLRQATVGLPALPGLTRGTFGFGLFNRNRVLVHVYLSSADTFVQGTQVIDLETLQDAGWQPASARATVLGDTGHVLLSQCNGEDCRGLSYHGAIGSNPWSYTLANGERLLRVDADGVLLGTTDGLHFVNPDGSTRFRSSASGGFKQPLRTANGDFITLRDTRLQRIAGASGTVVSEFVFPVPLSGTGLSATIEYQRVFVRGKESQEQEAKQLVFAADTLDPLFTLKGEAAGLTLAAASGHGPEQWVGHRLIVPFSTEAIRSERWLLSGDDAQILQRRTLGQFNRYLDRYWDFRPLALASEPAIASAFSYNATHNSIHVFRGQTVPLLRGTASLQLTLASAPHGTDQTFRLRLTNSGPDATTASLQMVQRDNAIVPQVLSCQSTQRSLPCAGWPGIDLPPQLALAAGEVVTLDLLPLRTNALPSPVVLRFTAFADAGTSEVDLTDNALEVLLDQSLFQNGFEQPSQAAGGAPNIRGEN